MLVIEAGVLAARQSNYLAAHLVGEGIDWPATTIAMDQGCCAVSTIRFLEPPQLPLRDA